MGRPPEPVSHDQEHDQVRGAMTGPDGDDHTLYSRLLVHFGSKHFYQPHAYDNDGLAVLLAWHDVVHGRDDVLAVERNFDPGVVEAIADSRRRYREAMRDN